MNISLFRSIWIVFLFFCLISFEAHAEKASPCTKFFYEDEIQVSGKIIEKTYAGPPNYQSIRGGDSTETVETLQLYKPICVYSKQGDQINEAAKNIKAIQLVEKFLESSRLKGRHAQIKGKLFSAQSAHHRTTVLLQVFDIRQAQ